jgi:hypothetical protein
MADNRALLRTIRAEDLPRLEATSRMVATLGPLEYWRAVVALDGEVVWACDHTSHLGQTIADLCARQRLKRIVDANGRVDEPTMTTGQVLVLAAERIESWPNWEYWSKFVSASIGQVAYEHDLPERAERAAIDTLANHLGLEVRRDARFAVDQWALRFSRGAIIEAFKAAAKGARGNARG